MSIEDWGKRAKLIAGGIPAIEFESLADLCWWLTLLNLIEPVSRHRTAGSIYISGRSEKIWYMIGLDLDKEGAIFRGKGLALFPMTKPQEEIAEAITRTYSDYTNEETEEAKKRDLYGKN